MVALQAVSCAGKAGSIEQCKPLCASIAGEFVAVGAVLGAGHAVHVEGVDPKALLAVEALDC